MSQFYDKNNILIHCGDRIKNKSTEGVVIFLDTYETLQIQWENGEEEEYPYTMYSQQLDDIEVIRDKDTQTTNLY